MSEKIGIPQFVAIEQEVRRKYSAVVKLSVFPELIVRASAAIWKLDGLVGFDLGLERTGLSN